MLIGRPMSPSAVHNLGHASALAWWTVEMSSGQLQVGSGQGAAIRTGGWLSWLLPQVEVRWVLKDYT